MRGRRYRIVLVTALALVACSEGRERPDASERPVSRDSGTSSDAGPGRDAGSPPDSGGLDVALGDAAAGDAGEALSDAALVDSGSADAVSPDVAFADAAFPDAAASPDAAAFADAAVFADASSGDATSAAGASVACREAHGDYFEDVLVTSAGTTLVGYTREYYGTRPPNQALIVRRAPGGAVVWQKRIGGSGEDAFARVLEGAGDTVVAFGNTTSFTGGSQEIWVVWFDANGQVLRERIYGGDGWDEVNGVRKTSDGGYLIAGNSGSFGALGYDGWLLKIDAVGQIVWQKSYGENSSDQDRLFDTVELADGWIVAGRTGSFGVVYDDLWVLRVNRTGDIVWQHRYQLGVDDRIYAALPAPDGVYLAGYTSDQLWALKLDTSGAVVWSKLIDNTMADTDVAFAAAPAANGFVTAGYTFYTHVFGSPPSHDYDFFLVQIDDAGQVAWNRAVGGEEAEWARGIAVRPGGGWRVTGWSESFAGVSLEPGSWVLDVEPDGSIAGRCNTEVAHAAALSVTDGAVMRFATPGVARATTAAATTVQSPESVAALSCGATMCAR